MQPRVRRQLSLIDWDFMAGDDAEIGGIHWYPGSFVPDLPGALIEALSSPTDRVFDPYGGIGTTGLAAIVRGRSAICCDSHPIAVLSSFVAMGLLALRFDHLELFDAVFTELDFLLTKESRTQTSFIFKSGTRLDQIDKYVNSISDQPSQQVYRWIRKGPPCIDALKPWYERRTLAKLLALVEAIDRYRECNFIRLVGYAMASAVARRLCSQIRSWGHVADNVWPTEFENKDVIQANQDWLWRTHARFRRIQQLAPLPARRPFYFPRLIDWTEGKVNLRRGLARLLVTSPPYAGAIDYTRAQRLSLYLTGRNADDVLRMGSREIGARNKRFGSSHVSKWANELINALPLQLPILSKDSFAAFVMPHKDTGRNLGEEALRDKMSELGWALAFSRDRSIKQTRTRQSWTSIKRETVLIFESQGAKKC